MTNTAKQEFTDLDADLKKQLKEITIARIRTVSNDTHISLGSEDYSSDELITHLEKNDEIGEELILLYNK